MSVLCVYVLYALCLCLNLGARLCNMGDVCVMSTCVSVMGMCMYAG